MKKSLFLLFFALFCVFRNINADEPIIFNAMTKSASCYITDKLAKGLNKQPVIITNRIPPMDHIQEPELKHLIGINRR